MIVRRKWVERHFGAKLEHRSEATSLYLPSALGTMLPVREVTMTTNMSSAYEAKRSPGLLDAANGLALVRVTIGSMFVWVFFENLGKGLYTTASYSGLISYYIKSSHSPAAWKAVMGVI